MNISAWEIGWLSPHPHLYLSFTVSLACHRYKKPLLDLPRVAQVTVNGP